MITLPWFQILSLVGLSLLTLLISFIPYFYTRFYRRGIYRTIDDAKPRTIFYCLLLFSSMTILTTGIVHVLPNAIEAMDDFRDDFSYPYVYIITAFTWFCCWVLDTHFDKENNTIVISHGIETFEDGTYPKLTPYFLTVALFVHSILEGMVLGSSPIEQATTDHDISKYLYILFVVLGVHKLVEAFCLGIVYEAYEYENMGIKMVCLGILSILTSGGVVIGLLLKNDIQDYIPVIAGVLCSICAGMFIYVGSCLLGAKIVPSWGRTNARYLAVLMGFIIPSAIAWLIYLDL